MTHPTKLIMIVVCGVLIVVISAVALAQGFPPQSPMGPGGPVGFPGPGYGMSMMPPAPIQPVMQVHSAHLFILTGDVLYKVNVYSLEQVGVLRLAPPPGGGPFGPAWMGPGGPAGPPAQ